MKKLLILSVLISWCFADIKVDLIESKNINYQGGMFGETQFRVICINGYQWLQIGDAEARSVSQMFENRVNVVGETKLYNGSSKAIPCINR